jgi:hypothetical protein
VGKLSRTLHQGIGGHVQPGGDRHAAQFARRGHRRERGRRAKIDHDAVALEILVGGDRVRDEVAAHSIGLFGRDRDTQVERAGTDDQRFVVRAPGDHARDPGGELRHDAAQDDPLEIVQAQPGFLQEAVEGHVILVRHPLADGLDAPVMRPRGAVVHAKHDVGIADVDRQ